MSAPLSADSSAEPCSYDAIKPAGRKEEAMIPGAFAYHRPTSVKEATSLLAQFGEEGRALAGGHSLIPMMKLRLGLSI